MPAGPGICSFSLILQNKEKLQLPQQASFQNMVETGETSHVEIHFGGACGVQIDKKNKKNPKLSHK